MTDVIHLSNSQAVAEEAARRWISIARQAVSERGKFSIALSGGSTPTMLYRIMASEEWAKQAPWAQTYVFWGDERRVPASHPESNYRMARESLLDHVPIPPANIFRMLNEGLARGDTDDYVKKLHRFFELDDREWPRFDLILLGMGADGHTASIFPGTRAVSDASNMVLVYEVPQLRKERITVTLPVINHARNILFMVTGEDKAEMLAKVLEGAAKPSTYPAQAVKPIDGSLVWLVDQAAAAKLTK